jgi:hypothetical protein
LKKLIKDLIPTTIGILIELIFLIAIQSYAFNFLSTFKEYPASQTAGDWSLSKVEKQIANMTNKSN